MTGSHLSPSTNFCPKLGKNVGKLTKRSGGRPVDMDEWCNSQRAPTGTQLARVTADGRGYVTEPVVTIQSLNLNACRLAADLYGPEDDVDTRSFGSRLPI
ncbi:hypothetical protein BQ8482_850004 [Mesorhizobium delmotii]|uniref:Uncharacterized protein n=1 Tax=Mesorhizobium delmotii TaxID=1631247 RepID=A0A2P9AWR0_9HYPH|nr:hypothetical protein BQ8482_850004 [Mesorhizobium delmotii]